MDTRILPPEFHSKLAELKKALDDEYITEKGFEKEKNALLEKYKQYTSVENNVIDSRINDLSISDYGRTSSDNGNNLQNFYAKNGDINLHQAYRSEDIGNNNPLHNLYSNNGEISNQDIPIFGRTNHHRYSSQLVMPPLHTNVHSHTRTHSVDAIDNSNRRTFLTSRKTDSLQMNGSNLNISATPPMPPPLDPNSSRWGSNSSPLAPGYMPVQPQQNYHSSPIGYGSVPRPVPGSHAIRPQPRPQYIRPPFNGDIPMPGRAQQLINEELDMGAGRPSYEATRFQDDNESIRSTKSYYGFKLDGSTSQTIPNDERFLKPEDIPERKDLENFDPSLSKLPGRQFMPFEPREIPFKVTEHLSNFSNIASILQYRSNNTPKKKAFIAVDQKGREIGDFTWEKLNSKAEKMGQIIIRDSGLMIGERVALIYRKNEILDFLTALYGCFYAGVVAVPINAVEKFDELLFILESSSAKLVLTTNNNYKVFTQDLSKQQKELPKTVLWWKTDDFGSLKKGERIGRFNSTELAYIEYTKSPNSELKGVVISHKTILAQCKVMSGSVVDHKYRKQVSEGSNGVTTWTQNTLLTYLEPRQQVGLLLGALWGVYSGNLTIFLASLGPDTPGVWINCVSNYQVTIALADYPGLNPVVTSFKNDQNSTQHTKFNKKDTSNLRSLRMLLIDTLTIDPMINEIIAEKFLTPLGVKYPLDVITPLISLPEHGGMILSFGDLLGVQGLDDRNEGERGIKEFLLSREGLKENKIIIWSGEGGRHKDKRFIKVGAFGFVMPEATIAVVDPETRALCLPDTVGEIWVDSPSLSGGFWNLPKHTESIFHARPIFVPPDTSKPEYFEQEFLRTGLLGTLINGQLVVFGLYEHRIRQFIEIKHVEAPKRLKVVNRGDDDNEDGNSSNEVEEEKKLDRWKYHYTLDLETTAKRMVEGVSECIAIEIYINEQSFTVLIAETNFSLERLPELGDNIFGAIESIHGLKLFCVSLCQSGSLPRFWKNGKKLLNSMLCKKAFEFGKLNVMHVRMNAVNTVIDLPIGEDVITGVWGPSSSTARQELTKELSVIRRPQVTRVENPQEVIDERTGTNMLKFRSIIDVLLWRCQAMPEEEAYKTIDKNGKEMKVLTWKKLSIKIATITNYLQKKGCKAGDHAVLIFQHGLDFVASVYACMILGIVAIPMNKIENERINEDIPSLCGIIDDFKVSYILINTESESIFKGRTIQNLLKGNAQNKSSGGSPSGSIVSINGLPPLINVSKAPAFKKTLKEANYSMQEEWLNQNWAAIVMCYFSADQRRYCVRFGHDNLLSLCKVQKETCRLTSNRALLCSVRSFMGVGFVHTFLIGIYLGTLTMMITPYDFSTNPLIWFETLSQYKIKDTYATFPMLQHAMAAFENLDYRSFSLQHLKNLMIPIETRPDPNLYKKIVKTFTENRLDSIVVNYVYSHIANPIITARSYMCIEPVELYLDLKSLRRGIVKIVNPDEPFAILLHDSGIVPVSTQVAIVHPETRRPCHTNELGEIWVSSDANAKSSYGSSDPLERAKFSATIEGGVDQRLYLRTGDLGFLHTVRRPVRDNGALVEFQCLFFLGPIAETFEVNGLMHFPVDIELTVERCHSLSYPGLIPPNGCVVFQANDDTVCTVEVRSVEGILNLVPCIISSILDEHQFIIDVIVFISNGNLPKSRLGEKQRAKVMDSWLRGTLQALHVHYVKPLKARPKIIPKFPQSKSSNS
ncbi:44235_t:CDS:10 [Gigaspora margarita]|uniref:44235_t:CDS:1 n=1 Tax=Gigaspora margarita TaxID=4874 RepID=A0ABN7UMS7_GIGMA|nr:44235_t:CDS:10 [Gigaspora margarita]